MKKKKNKFILITRTAMIWIPVLTFFLLEVGDFISNLQIIKLINEKIISLTTSFFEYKYAFLIIESFALGFFITISTSILNDEKDDN